MCAPGALALIFMAIRAKSRICKVPIAPYHIGPQTPYEYAKVELVRSVADHVHAVGVVSRNLLLIGLLKLTGNYTRSNETWLHRS